MNIAKPACRFVLGMVAWWCLVPICSAAFPDKPIRLVVPLAAGGGTDVLARLLGQKLSERLGQPVIIDNKPGANQLIGGDFVAKAQPDGYTLLMGGSSMTLLALSKQPRLDMRRDLLPITIFAETPYVVLANRDAPFKTLPELIAYGRANPGKVAYGTSGTGGSTHLLGEYLAKMAGIKMVAVAYKGSGPQTVGLMAGETQLSIDGIGASNQLIREGRIVLLATSGSTRTSVFPNVPTVAETLPGFVAKGWYGVQAPLGTPKDVIDKLHLAIAAIAAMPDVQEKLSGMSLDPGKSTPQDYARLIAGDVDRWGGILRDAGIVLD